jgi:hypothetical protein
MQTIDTQNYHLTQKESQQRTADAVQECHLLLCFLSYIHGFTVLNSHVTSMAPFIDHTLELWRGK